MTYVFIFIFILEIDRYLGIHATSSSDKLPTCCVSSQSKLFIPHEYNLSSLSPRMITLPAYHILQTSLVQSLYPDTITSTGNQISTGANGAIPDVIIPSPLGELRSNYEHSTSSLSPPTEQPTRIFFPGDTTEAQKLVLDDFKKHQCQVCFKWFKRASSLSNHRLIHKNLKSFKCEHCGMCFLRKSDLGKHVVIHSGKKPYECSTCGKRFSQSSNMLTHQRRHSGVRPYSCAYCGKSFYRKVDVRRHSIVHRDF